ncbi:MAG: Coenzyme F420 hydrogenase/dehydrogenase, beta subunit C-terminal domain, partial [Acidobacteriota bacterium]
MSKLLKINNGLEQGIINFLEFLLEEKKVQGVITLKKTNGDQGLCYSLITEAEKLKDARPFYPLMPANAGKILSALTSDESLAEPLAVVMRPCELRSFIELVKRIKGRMENFLIISPTCPGVYPLELSSDGGLEKNLSQYWQAVKNAETIPDTRTSCRSCLYFIPRNADIIVDVIGKKDLDKSCYLFLNTKKGEELAAGMKGDIKEQEIETGELDRIQKEREEYRKKLFEEIEIEEQGIKG